MRQLADSFHPITAAPFQNDAVYCEVAPCDALRPFIRCFWGTKTPLTVSLTEPVYSPVIPDACMDILFKTDYTHNSYSANFCPIDEQAFFTPSGTNQNVTATFGIRFYAWSAVLFADGDFRGERFYSAEAFSRELTAQITPILFEIPSLQGKIAFAEKILLEKLNLSKMNNDLLNSIDFMITTCGRESISEVCAYAAEYECEYITENQLPDGSFPVTWQWWTDYKEFEVAKNYWKAIITIKNMRYLQAFGKR